jgi:amino acid permease
MNKASERDSHRTSPRDDESGLYSIRSDVSEPTYKSGTHEVPSFFNFVKASIGSGSFVLPWAMKQSGIIVGSAGLILLGVVSAYTMQLLIQCKQRASRGLPPERKREFTFTDVGRVAAGTVGKWSVDFSVILCNIGVCAGYTVFIASNLRWAITCLPVGVNPANPQLNVQDFEVYLCLLPILILLTFLPSFKYLAYAAYVGFIFLVVAMITVYVYATKHSFFGVEFGVSYYEWRTLPQFFGAAAFLFCVHTMVIPVESSMKRPSNMQYVIDAAAFIVVAVNLPFAIYGYLLFGHQVKGYCFENLIGLYPDIIRLTLALELTLTYPIVIKPPSDVVEEIGVLIYDWAHKESNVGRIQAGYKEINEEDSPVREACCACCGKICNPVNCVALCTCCKIIGSKLSAVAEVIKKGLRLILLPYTKTAGTRRKIVRTLLVWTLRAGLVLTAFAIAYAIPFFNLIVALVGGLATTIAAFILPPLFHIMLFWRIRPKGITILNAAIFVFGILASVITTVTTIMSVIDAPPPSPIDCYGGTGIPPSNHTANVSSILLNRY